MSNLNTIRNSVAPTLESLNVTIATSLPVQSVNDIEDTERRERAAVVLERAWKLSEYLPAKLYEVRDADALDACTTGTGMLSKQLHALVELFAGTDYADAATPIARWAKQLHERVVEAA